MEMNYNGYNANYNNRGYSSGYNSSGQYYTGGARPTRQMLNLMELDRQQALLKIQAKGLSEKFKEWKEKFGKKKKTKFPVPKDRINDAGFQPKTREQMIESIKNINWGKSTPRPVGDLEQIRRDKMPLPQNRTTILDESLSTYRNRLGLTNMPPMAF